MGLTIYDLAFLAFALAGIAIVGLIYVTIIERNQWQEEKKMWHKELIDLANKIYFDKRNDYITNETLKQSEVPFNPGPYQTNLSNGLPQEEEWVPFEKVPLKDLNQVKGVTNNG